MPLPSAHPPETPPSWPTPQGLKFWVQRAGLPAGGEVSLGTGAQMHTVMHFLTAHAGKTGKLCLCIFMGSHHEILENGGSGSQTMCVSC